mgnify:CR=1 FL=1
MDIFHQYLNLFHHFPSEILLFQIVQDNIYPKMKLELPYLRRNLMELHLKKVLRLHRSCHTCDTRSRAPPCASSA